MDHFHPQKISDRYEDLGQLGQGGMGEVRRVFDQILGRTVAMKLVHTDRMSDDFLARFIEEAQVSARLQHPNILPIHDLGQLPNGRFYFTMKIAEGESLHKRIKHLHHLSSVDGWVLEGQPYSLRRLLTAFKQVCDAIAYAHTRGVIHRDIKPQNVIIGDHGSVQVLDWGIAKRLEGYFTEWVNEVIGHFQITLTPTNEIIQEINNEERSPKNDEVDRSLVEAIQENFDRDQLSLVDTIDAFSKINYTHISTSIELDQTPVHSHEESGQTQLSRFSMSSGDLIEMDLSNFTQRTSEESIAGTLDYMAPEQLRGELNQISYYTDVYGLGVVLYELLTNHLPFKVPKAMKDTSILKKIKYGIKRREEKIKWPDDTPSIPEELKAICEKAMSCHPSDRFSSALELADSMVRYLDGVGRREKGLAKVSDADSYLRGAQELHEKAHQLLEKGKVQNDLVQPTDSEESKRSVWRQLDQAKELTYKAIQLEHDAERALYDALLFDDLLTEAHSQLVERAHQSHITAEMSNDEVESHRQLAIIRRHITHSPPALADRLKRYLSPTAPIDLQFAVSSTVEMSVSAQRYIERDRRLVLSEAEDWGRSSHIQKDVELGRYLITVKAEGFEDLKYPIWVEREYGWRCKTPSEDLHPIPMLQVDQSLAGLRYVPPGWFYAGGDGLVSNSVPQKRRLWADGFLMSDKHITHQEYLIFLQDLCRRGDYDLAYHLRPRLRDEEGEGLYRFHQGQVHIIENEFIRLDWPANYTNYECALCYTKWSAERMGQGIRLPSDMEWEKMARSVDARSFPWGEHFDPSFAHMRLSLEIPQPATPFAWPADQSPWGHWALAGSMRDWTCTLFKTPFPYEEGSRVIVPNQMERDDLDRDRVVRGGSWKTQEGNCRTAFRFVATSNYRDDDGSFRLALSLSDLTSANK